MEDDPPAIRRVVCVHINSRRREQTVGPIVADARRFDAPDIGVKNLARKDKPCTSARHRRRPCALFGCCNLAWPV